VMSASSLSESGNPNRRLRETDGNAGTRERGAPESDSEEGPVTNRAFLLQGHT